MLASTRRLLASLSSQTWPPATSKQAWPPATGQAWPLTSSSDSIESQAWPLASSSDSIESQAWPLASWDLAIVCMDGTVRFSCFLMAAASPLLRSALVESEVLVLPWANTATVTEGLAALLQTSRPRLTPETNELLHNLGINSPVILESKIKLDQTSETCGVIEDNEVASKRNDKKCQKLQECSDLKSIRYDCDLKKGKQMKTEGIISTFNCDHCNAKFTNQQTLRLHMEKEHALECKIIVKCKEEGCNYATSSKRYLKSHTRRVHSGMKHLCNACGRTFGDKRELISHTTAIHEEKNLPCSYCDKLYPSEKHRDRHERLVHATELAYQCDECPQSYKHPSSLHKHKLSVHRGEAGKKFKCDQCDMAFITNDKLTHHKRSHTGEKHYACQYCGMGFIDPSAMSRHRKTHEGGAKFECDLCSKTYTQSYDVVKHKMTVHGVIIKSKRQHGNKEKKLKRYQKPGRFSEEVLGINLT